MTTLLITYSFAFKTIKRFNYEMPSQYLIDAYEQKKEDYLKKIIKDYAEESNGGKEKINSPVPREIEVYAYKLHLSKVKNIDIATKLNISERTVRNYLKKVKLFQELPENTSVCLIVAFQKD